MLQRFLEKKYSLFLETADVQINGSRPWDIQVHNKNLYRRFLLYGTLGLGEAYMDGWWDCEHLDKFFTRVIRALGQRRLIAPSYFFHWLRATLLNMQSIKRARLVGKRHYDTSPELMKKILGEDMIYSCGYWRNAQDLKQAQQAKLKLVMDKLMLKPGMKVLDIGCGWGGSAKYVAENYGVSVVGITISRKQAEMARQVCHGLPVEIHLQDYRALQQKFDRIYSVGMFEHVGYKNHAAFMQVVRRCLKDGGLFVLHTIGKNRSVKSACPWINKYIFPGGTLPSTTQISHAIENILVIEDWQNFGLDYDKTLMSWYENLQRAWNGADERFYRMWKYYLLVCAALFRAHTAFLWQIVLTPEGLPKTYYAPR